VKSQIFWCLSEVQPKNRFISSKGLAFQSARPVADLAATLRPVFSTLAVIKCTGFQEQVMENQVNHAKGPADCDKPEK